MLNFPDAYIPCARPLSNGCKVLLIFGIPIRKNVGNVFFFRDSGRPCAKFDMCSLPLLALPAQSDQQRATRIQFNTSRKPLTNSKKNAEIFSILLPRKTVGPREASQPLLAFHSLLPPLPVSTAPPLRRCPPRCGAGRGEGGDVGGGDVGGAMRWFERRLIWSCQYRILVLAWCR